MKEIAGTRTNLTCLRAPSSLPSYSLTYQDQVKIGQGQGPHQLDEDQTPDPQKKISCSSIVQNTC